MNTKLLTSILQSSNELIISEEGKETNLFPGMRVICFRYSKSVIYCSAIPAGGRSREVRVDSGGSKNKRAAVREDFDIR